jgi:alpha-tubulin suppressor-like RCC1 family protein
VLRPDSAFRLWGIVLQNGASQDLPGESPLTARYAQIPQPAAVAVGGDEIVALDRAGTVWMWGAGSTLFSAGYSNPSEEAVPRPVAGLESITMIAAGLYHALALRSNGTVWSWGDSDMEGQLGQGPGWHSHAPPRRVRGIGDIVAIGAGWSHSLAVTRAGEVWQWGYMGAGPLRNRNLAEKVPGLTGVTAVDGGYGHSLALKKDGTVWAWGWNKFQQLGDGTAIDRIGPVQVKSLAGVVAVAAGHHFSAALKADGSVWVWGSNDPRILGTARGPSRLPSPLRVENLPPIVAIDAGQSHLVALDKDGAVWEWGHNWLQPKKFPR